MPLSPDAFAAESIKQFKENLRVVGQGIPILPGIKTPDQLEEEVRQKNAPNQGFKWPSPPGGVVPLSTLLGNQ